MQILEINRVTILQQIVIYPICCSSRKMLCTKLFTDSLGGFFQTCYCDGGRECDQCEDYVVKNFLTGDTTCPDMYSPVYLSGKSLPYCWKSCYPWYIFWTKCDRHCFNYEYKAYWCAANHYPIPQNTGLMFGGVFMDAAKNPVTGKSYRRASLSY